MECYQSSSAAGTPLALKVFISGRGRLENEGSKALSEVFKVGIFCEASYFQILKGHSRNDIKIDNYSYVLIKKTNVDLNLFLIH